MECKLEVKASDFEMVKSLTAQFEYCVLNVNNSVLSDNYLCLI